MTGWRRSGDHGAERLTVAGAGGEALSFAEVLAGWRDDRAFRAATVAALAHGAPAYF